MNNLLTFIVMTLFCLPSLGGQPGGYLSKNDSCSYLKKCDSNNSCSDKNDECYSLGVCDDPVCVSEKQACLKECGTTKCSVMESSPLQVNCN